MRMSLKEREFPMLSWDGCVTTRNPYWALELFDSINILSPNGVVLRSTYDAIGKSIVYEVCPSGNNSWLPLILPMELKKW